MSAFFTIQRYALSSDARKLGIFGEETRFVRPVSRKLRRVSKCVGMVFTEAGRVV